MQALCRSSKTWLCAKDGKRFIPEHRGRIVSTFLENFFTRYVEYDFTAALEAKLDQVSDGKMDWRALLKQFWVDFAVAIEKAMTLSVPDVMKTLDSELENCFSHQMKTVKFSVSAANANRTS